MPDAEPQRPPSAPCSSNTPGERGREAGDRTLSDLDRSHSDADHSASHADQAGADADQSASDADQAIADREQQKAAPDSPSWHAYEDSRRQRTRASAGRTGVSAGRDASAVFRASTARARTDGSTQRDEAAFEDEVRRRAAEQVEHERAVLTEAEELAGAGSWELDLRDRVLRWSAGMYRIRGRKPSPRTLTVADATLGVHPDDHVRVTAAAARVDVADDDLRSSYRIVRPDDSVRHVETRARVQRDSDGRPWRLVGVEVDVTARREIEIARLRAESELAAARKLADDAICAARDEAERAKSDFLLELQAQNRTLDAKVRIRTHELDQARLEAFEKLALAAEYRDDDTREHTQRVGHVARLLAIELGLHPAAAQTLAQVAPLHDLGKIAIPDAILLTPGSLDAAQFAVMKEHTLIGAQIMSSDSPLFTMAGEIALCHHERWDGSGYPHGIADRQIPLWARIVSVVDAFDAISHERPYKPPWPLEKTLEEINRCRGSQFDPDIVEAFMRLDHPTLLHLPAPELTPPAARASRHLL